MINTTNDPSTPPTQRSIGELVQSIRDEALAVVHHEIDIAKKEFTALAVKAGIIAAFAAVMLFLLLSAWVMLLFFAASGLHALGMPWWGAFLLVAGVFIVLSLIAAGAAFLVSRRMKAPKTTIDTAKGAVGAFQGKRHANAVSYGDVAEELYGKKAPAAPAMSPTPTAPSGETARPRTGASAV